MKPRRDGLTYDAMWTSALRARPDLVTITSYNEWSEGTQIEPAKPQPAAGAYLSYDGAWGRHGRAASRAYLWRTGCWTAVLAGAGCLSERTTVVHATHASDRELDLVADAGARICVCPTTEANLGDGFAPVERICERGIGICIGSDSNVRIDPLEELRELEGIARRQAGRRNVLSTERLLCYGADEGAGALGLERWAEVTVDLEHRSLRGLEDADVFSALVFGCSAEVLSSG